MNFKNTRQQGDAGVGATIAYCTSLGHTVSLPLGEGQRYDLIVEAEQGRLLRVQCKTAFGKNRQGNYQAELRTSGGNRSGTGRVSYINANEIEGVAILDGDGRLWWFQASDLADRRSVSLSRKKYGEKLCYDPRAATP